MLEIKQMELKDFQDAKMAMRQSMTKTTEGFVEMGFILKEMKMKELYLEAGYKDIWAAAENEFKIKRKLAWSLMNIINKFTVGGNSMQLLPRFEGYNKSLLIEMITLPEEDYELFSPEAKVEDIQELKRAEREQAEEKKVELEGQMSLINDMPDVVPEAEKPKKEEATITDVLREMFRPREMKEYLDQLVNMDPESQSMEWWVGDFNQTGYRKFRKKPFYLYFYGREEGIKIKNIKTGEIQSKTYKDFYFLVRAAFATEKAAGTDVWNKAFGEEYEAEMRRQKEEEQRKQDEEKRKKEFQKQKEEKQYKAKGNQEKAASNEIKNIAAEKKEEEDGGELKKIDENSDFDNKNGVSDNDNEEIETENEKNVTENSEIVTGEVEDSENGLCDIAQEWEFTNTEKLPRNTYNEIVTGKRRHFVSNFELREGSRIRFTPTLQEKKEIRAVITVMDEIKGTAMNVYGFKVISIGTEE